MDAQPALAPVLSLRLNEETSQSASRGSAGEVPFDNILESEELKLKERQKLLSLIPWGTFSNTFFFVPAKFDFKFSAAEANLTDSERGHTLNTENQGTLSSAKDTSNAASGPANITLERSTEKMQYSIEQNRFVSNLMASVRPVFGNAPTPTSSSAIVDIKNKGADLEMIISDIVDKIKIVKDGKSLSLSLALNNGDLGELMMNASLKGGVISISITGEQKTIDLLSANIKYLEESLKGANINLGDLSLSYNKKESGQTKELSADPVFSEHFVIKPRTIGMHTAQYIYQDPSAYAKFFGFGNTLIYSQA